jgi:hypothetical protein
VGSYRHASNEFMDMDIPFAHSCEQCRNIAIRRPSRQEVEGARAGAVLRVLEVAGAKVFEPASQGCAFLRGPSLSLIKTTIPQK